MAKRKSNSNHWHGSVGNVVHCTWMGIEYIRAKPAYVNDPKTTKQLKQRNKLKVCHAFVQTLLYTVRKGFAAQAVGKTAYNACMSRLLKQAVVVQNDTVQLDYSKVVLGEGPLAVAQGVNVTVQEQQLTISWQSEGELGNGSITDRSMVAIYNVEKGQAIQQQGGALRGDGVQVVSLPANWQSDTLQCYLGFEDQMQSSCSNVVHVGEVVVKTITDKRQQVTDLGIANHAYEETPVCVESERASSASDLLSATLTANHYWGWVP